MLDRRGFLVRYVGLAGELVVRFEKVVILIVD
jgi:hypothetical protein